MAWTSVGFDGTITEIQWAGMASLLGNGYVAAGNGDCLVTAVPGARSVSVAAGSLYGDGVLSTNSGAETVAMTTPTNGQWYVIALRRTWATNTAALVAIAGATTTTTTPTAPPTSFPTLNTNVGVLTDQPIAWAWCNSANTTVVVYDIRLKAVKSLPPVVATQAERDAKFMSPTQGLQVWRDDLGAVQTYYGLYNSSTNPGGRDTAGWYSNDRAGGLVPIRPTTATIGTGSGSANSMGMVSFSGATSVSLDGVFSSEFTNYKVIFNGYSSSSGVDMLRVRTRAGGTDFSGANTYWYLVYNGSTSDTYMARQSFATADTFAAIGYLGYDQGNSIKTIDVFNPANSSVRTALNVSGVYSYAGLPNVGVATGTHNQAVTVDGLTIYPAAGNMTGYIQVFGYND